jgi:modulator of FtsH protease
MTSLQSAEWHDLFVAIAGAAAALAGLLFVAVSINLSRILKFEVLPTRAVETLSIMIGLLLLAVIMLIPGTTALGTEILILGLGLTVLLLPKRLLIRRNKDEPLTWTLTPIAIVVAGSLPMVAAGISVLARVGGGLYWLVPEIVLGFIGAIMNAWILLVEIHR